MMFPNGLKYLRDYKMKRIIIRFANLAFSVSAVATISFIIMISSNKSLGTQDNGPSESIECFDEFIIRFKSDSLFQKERIKFPLKWTAYNLSNDKLEDYEILKEQWNYEKFDDRSQPDTYDRYSIEIERIKGNKVHLIKKGIDNGIRIVYCFVAQRDIWNLGRVIDYST